MQRRSGVLLRRSRDIFVITLCWFNRGVLRRVFGKRPDLIRLDVSDAIHLAGHHLAGHHLAGHHLAGHYNSPCGSLGKVEQGADPL